MKNNILRTTYSCNISNDSNILRFTRLVSTQPFKRTNQYVNKKHANVYQFDLISFPILFIFFGHAKVTAFFNQHLILSLAYKLINIPEKSYGLLKNCPKMVQNVYIAH